MTTNNFGWRRINTNLISLFKEDLQYIRYSRKLFIEVRTPPPPPVISFNIHERNYDMEVWSPTVVCCGVCLSLKSASGSVRSSYLKHVRIFFLYSYLYLVNKNFRLRFTFIFVPLYQKFYLAKHFFVDQNHQTYLLACLR